MVVLLTSPHKDMAPSDNDLLILFQKILSKTLGKSSSHAPGEKKPNLVQLELGIKKLDRTK